jgi:hypothetical protein
MHAPITVNYVPDGEDWTVTVTDEDQTQQATASGLIAARDQADQIVEKMKMVPSETSRTVVHLLEGDAVAFTNTYLQVRLGLSTPEVTQAEPHAQAQPPTATTPTPTAPAPTAATPTAATPTAPPEAGAEAPKAQSPAPETPATPNPPAEAPPSAPSGNSPELANVPAQGANQAS